MKQSEFSDGELILTEGEPSDFVYRILLGEVEIFTVQGTDTIALGVAKAGEFLGEMGIIERRPRSASARAKGQVLIEQLERWEFVQLISDSPMSANRLIERLSERLRHANSRLTQATSASRLTAAAAQPDKAQIANGEPAPVRLLAGSERLTACLPELGININTFPFTVGREPRGEERRPIAEVHLQVPDAIPYRLSFAHFSLVRSYEGYAVRDLGSSQGTNVNGAFIGEHFDRDICPLNAGKNIVTAGGINSAFRFEAVIDMWQT